MKTKVWIDCNICCRTHEALHYDCRSFFTCPFCGDAYHLFDFEDHKTNCNGIALSSLPGAIFVEED